MLKMLLDNDDDVDAELNLIKNALQQEQVCGIKNRFVVLVSSHYNNVVSLRTVDGTVVVKQFDKKVTFSS